MAEKKNTVEKQKTGLRVLGIISLVLFAGAMTGAILLLLGCQEKFKIHENDTAILWLVWGIILAVFCIIAFFWGLYAVWISTAIKATKGSIADPAVVKGTVNGVKCPKCGCVNTPDSEKCQNCGEPLPKE